MKHIPRPAVLIDSSALRRLCQTWRSDLKRLEKLAPNAELTTMLRVLIKELEAALCESEKTDMFVTVEQAAEITNRPESSIRRWCDSHGPEIGAVKLDGRWSIDWNVFEPWARSNGARPGEAA